MILNMTTKEFSEMSVASKKKLFSYVLNSKVQNIVSWSMTNEKWGEYRVRHDEYAYSNLKIEPSKLGLTKVSVYNFETGEWEDEAR